MLEVKGFSKRYKGAERYSAKDIDFSVADGEIVGLIGENGAGKSTTIKSIVGILPFKEGQIVVNGFDVNKEPIQAKQTVGYVPDDHAVYEKLTGREYANYIGSLYGVPKEQKEELIEYYANMFNLDKKLDNQIASYSHGMKQKICLIGSLLHKPKLWVLDEPMMGLDPTATSQVKSCIKDYASKGNIVLFSSHNLDIVEKLCDKVAIIREGELVAFIDLREAKKDADFDLEELFAKINGGRE